MSNTVIKVENLSKQYRLGNVGTGSFAHDINRTWHRMLGKEDPYLKIGEENDRSIKGTSEYVWALKNINFEVKEGEVVGIIGRNGAGKSTLLKLLSRTTSPTSGRIKIKGRVASLLEVGTGFHPELTGRENIFLNGAILGMTKREIKSKFDEIVDFSGVERYIDTPVKRYSSGMHVRLAFGVAAHLDPEILIVDEVLAVGDAEFQKKALGKMQDVSTNGGRTVLFVSHNIVSINRLCNKGIYLVNGSIQHAGEIEDTIDAYQQSIVFSKSHKSVYLSKETEEKDIQILAIKISDEEGNEKGIFDVFDPVFVEFEMIIKKEDARFTTPILLVEKDGVELFWSFASDLQPGILDSLPIGRHKFKVQLPSPLKKGVYNIHGTVGQPGIGNIDIAYDAVQFKVDELSFNPANASFAGGRGGVIPALLSWEKVD